MTDNQERLAPYMQPLDPSEHPQPCRRCRHRHMLRWLLNVPFCEHSSYTCQHRTKRCDEFQGDYGQQLELF